ncbi:MAG: hypothetical protein NVSMB25_22610 [Thermoleophilaceae bacterium]
MRDSVSDPTLTYVLIAVNVLVQLASSFGSGSGGSLQTHGWLDAPDVAAGEVWRLVTAGFLHAGFIHIAFNVYVLYVLGSMLEPAIGRLRFGLIYFVSLLAGSFGALLLSPNSPTVGASGAIFGLAGAALVIMRNRGVRPMDSGLPLFIGINLLLTVTLSNVSIGGHIGGLIGGALAAVLMYELPGRLRLPSFAPALLAVALAAVAIAASIAVAGSA